MFVPSNRLQSIQINKAHVPKAHQSTEHGEKLLHRAQYKINISQINIMFFYLYYVAWYQDFYEKTQ